MQTFVEDHQEQITIQNFRTEKRGPLQPDYSNLVKINKGNYGNVYSCVHNATRTVRCIKVYNKELLKKSNQTNFKTEMDILKDLDHPNIYKIYECYEDSMNYYLICEYLDGRELFDYMQDHSQVTESVAFKIIEQLLSAVNYLHTHNVIHRDIKPENIMLLKKDDPSIIKLIDFGTSKRFEKNQKFSTPIGSCYYMAPEQIMGKYDKRVDVWACGIILYVLMVGYPPFNGEKDSEILSKIVKQPLIFDPEDWNKISAAGKDLVSRMLEKNPDKRLTMDKIFAHPWFLKHCPTKFNESAVNILKRFEEFTNNSQLEKILRIYMVQCFDLKNEIIELNALFRTMDTDHDGSISKAELHETCKKLNIKLNENELLKFVDSNSDNTVNYSEFLGALIDFRKATSKTMLKSIFQSIDADNNGFISKEELIKFLNVESNSQIVEQLFMEVDKNGDNKISFAEFMDNLNHI